MSGIGRFEIVDINQRGITLKNGSANIHIRFDECAKNYANQHYLKTSRCVATRDIERLTFTFYTNPKIKVAFKKHLMKDLLGGKSAVSKFLELQKAINNYGYTSYDLS